MRLPDSLCWQLQTSISPRGRRQSSESIYPRHRRRENFSEEGLVIQAPMSMGPNDDLTSLAKGGSAWHRNA